MIIDFLFILKWWLPIFGIGLIFLPLSAYLFSGFFDKGYIFSKILGIIFVSFFVFILGILKILPFTQITIFLALFSFLILNLFIFFKAQTYRKINFKINWKIFIIEEFIFLITLTFWSFIKAYQPDIHGLEKFMDFGFINSILRSEYFPPDDMWLTPYPINYYYFGHFITAFLTKISLIPSNISYNLMLSTIFAFTFTEAFSIGANLIFFKLNPSTTSGQSSKPLRISNLKHLNLFKRLTFFRIFLGGILTAFLLTFAGNLHAIYTLFKPYVNEKPVPFWQLLFSPDTFPNSYWYPNATRFIFNTIHEFPIYSFVVSDLHGHVLDIPIVLLTIAFLLSLIQNLTLRQNSGQEDKVQSASWLTKLKIIKLLPFNFYLLTLLLAFLLAVMYMTNAWDGAIYFLLSSIIIGYLIFRSSHNFSSQVKNAKLKMQSYNLKFRIINIPLLSSILYLLFSIFLLVVGFLLFSLPFSLNFKPFVSGIGILCAPSFLTNIDKIGPFLFEANHCQRSPLWQLLILYGFFYFWTISFLIKLKITTQNVKRFRFWNLFRISNLDIRILRQSDLFVIILIALATLLIILPEFIYIKDIYPAHYRANTMFKLAYQAFIMLSISTGYIIVIIFNLRKKISSILYFLLSVFIFFIVMIYPYFAITSYFENFRTYHGLDGTAYLEKFYPADYKAILWINKNIKGKPVILEAQGDSYTDYARISANTGLPTVLGWTVHEWLWRGKYEIPAPRITEIQTLYEVKDLETTKKLIKKYNISLVFVGDLEKQKYINLKEEKFKILGSEIFKNGKTTIYLIGSVK